VKTRSDWAIHTTPNRREDAMAGSNHDETMKRQIILREIDELLGLGGSTHRIDQSLQLGNEFSDVALQQ